MSKATAAGVDTGEWVLRLGYPAPPLSLNQRLHWANKARLTKEIRARVHLLAQAAHLPKHLPAATVGLVWTPRVNRRRDRDNLVATLKPCLDGLVGYGLIDDDDHGHLDFWVRIAAPDRDMADPDRVQLHIAARKPFRR